MVELLGRNWTTLTPILREGGDAIRENAKSQADGLIVTEKAAEAAEATRRAQDELNDAFTATKNTLANELIPAVATFLEKVNEDMLRRGLTSEAMESYHKGLITQAELYKIDAKAITDLTAAQKMYDDLLASKAFPVNQNMVHATYELEHATEDSRKELVFLGDVEGDYVNKANEAAAASERQKKATEELTAAQKDVNSAMTEMGSAEAQLQTATQNLYNQLGGMAVASADKAHQSAKRTLEAYKIQDEAFGTHTALTVEKTGEVDKATQEFMNSPQKEADKQAYLKRLDEIKAKYAETDTSIEASKQKVQELQGVIDSLTGKVIQIIVKTYHEDIQGSPPKGDVGGTPRPKRNEPMAAGGPVTGPGDYTLGEEGVEKLHLNPGSSGYVTNNYNYNLAIHSNARSENLQADFHILKSIHNTGV
jgi:hypothetical protein